MSATQTIRYHYDGTDVRFCDTSVIDTTKSDQDVQWGIIKLNLDETYLSAVKWADVVDIGDEKLFMIENHDQRKEIVVLKVDNTRTKEVVKMEKLEQYES